MYHFYIVEWCEAKAAARHWVYCMSNSYVLMPNDYMVGFLHCGLLSGMLVLYCGLFNLFRKKMN